MARKTPEDRLLDQIVNAVCDTRFSRYLFAQHATSHPERVRIFDLCLAFTELYAIHADYGDFEASEVDHVMLARRIRDQVIRASERIDDDGGG